MFFIVLFKRFLFSLLEGSLDPFEGNNTLADASNQTDVKTKDKTVGKIIYSKSVTTQYKTEHFLKHWSLSRSKKII